MKDIQYTIAKIISKLKREKHKETIIKFFRKQGIKIGGGGTNICCNIVTPESYLIEIGNNVTIGDKVDFITHDNSISKISPETINLFGKIVIGNNCFIGERSTILYGVILADNIIVAAGSVVVDSFLTERIIIGGNPARVISTWEKFFEKSKDHARGRKDIQQVLCEHPELLVKRKSKG